MRKMFFLAALLLMASCIPQTSTEVDYHTGTEGITIEFLEDSPPDELYEDTQFPVYVVIHNEGAQAVPFKSNLDNDEWTSFEGRLALSYDSFYIENVLDEDSPEWVDAQERLNSVSLLGRSDLVPQGEEKIVKIADLRTNRVVGERESPETQVYASICYPYQTTFSSDVCFDVTTSSRDLRDQVCQARDISSRSGQGAPVAITMVEVDMVPVGDILVRPTFAVHIENIGSGNIVRAIDPSTNINEACTQRSGDRNDINTVYVIGEFAGVPLECEPNPFRMVGDESLIFCTVSEEDLEENQRIFGSQSNFMTSLNINLIYAYSNGISKEVEIIRKPSDFIRDINSAEGECSPWEREVADGKCEDRCILESGYSCQDASIYEAFDCRPDTDLCAPGQFCCKEKIRTCNEFDGERQGCLDEGAGCVYCVDNNKCVNSCTECGYDGDVRQPSGTDICEIIEGEDDES